jgi:pyruvate kinase
VEIPLEKVPQIQKELIKKCLKVSKPIIVATQMMEGMIDNIRPTRAEVNDIANSVMDGADALMLSGETSVGKYPVEVIETMQKIINQVESFDDIYFKLHDNGDASSDRFISDSILNSAVKLARDVNAKAIITNTHSGYSALKLSAQRPKCNVFVFTETRKLLSTLSLVWGLKGFYYNKYESTDGTIEDLKNHLLKNKLIEKGDLIINIASIPCKDKGMTNMLKLSRV